MSKTKAQSIENAKSEDIEYELDETVPLPTLPTWKNISTDAANDESFAGKGRNENIERLIALAESIDNHLKVIAGAAVGSFIAIAVPWLHKVRPGEISLVPVLGESVGLGVRLGL